IAVSCSSSLQTRPIRHNDAFPLPPESIPESWLLVAEPAPLLRRFSLRDIITKIDIRLFGNLEYSICINYICPQEHGICRARHATPLKSDFAAKPARLVGNQSNHYVRFSRQ